MGPVILNASATAAAGSGVTATTITPTGEQRIHLVSLEVVRFAAALLVAGAAITNVTVTTGLSMNIPFPTDAAAQGSLHRYLYEPCIPLPSQLKGSVLTVTCPATTDVIWRVNMAYFLAN